MALAFLEHYRKSILQATSAGGVGEVTRRSGHGAIWELLGSTASGVQEALLARNMKRRGNGRPSIRRTDNHRDVSRKRFELIREVVQAYGQTVKAPKAFHVHDVTGRIAGVGSLGVRRYLTLLEGEGAPDGYWLFPEKRDRMNGDEPARERAIR
jgi:uncharacterized protein (DUF2252 family)